jgi:hypothetical protein
MRRLILSISWVLSFGACAMAENVAGTRPGQPVSVEDRIRAEIARGGYRQGHHTPDAFKWISDEPARCVAAIEVHLRIPTSYSKGKALPAETDETLRYSPAAFSLVRFLDNENAGRICVELFVQASCGVRRALVEHGFELVERPETVRTKDEQLYRYLSALHAIERASLDELSRRRLSIMIEYPLLTYTQMEWWDVPYSLIAYYDSVGSAEGLIRIVELTTDGDWHGFAKSARGCLARRTLTDAQASRLKATDQRKRN